MNTAIIALLICNVGGPSNTRQAQPVVDKFLRRMEKAGGWAPNTLTGAYFTKVADCERYRAAKNAKMVVTDLATYLEKQKDWQLSPLAHMGTTKATRYHLLVREGSFKDMAALQGKVLVSTLAERPRFLSRIIFGGKIDAAKHFTLKHTRRPLKGLRQVARKQADATLVDELAYQYLKDLKLPAKLVSIHASQYLPGLTMTLSGKDAKLRKRVLKVLPTLCQGPGVELCKTFRIKAFGRANAAVYGKLARQYR